MCHVGKLSHRPELSPPFATFTRPPQLHAALVQATATEAADSDDDEEPYDSDVYDDCDIPLDVVSDHLLSGSIADHFAIDVHGGIARSGDAETSDAEAEVSDHEPEVLGRGKCRKFVASRYQGLAWEQH